jgi:endoglucanase
MQRTVRDRRNVVGLSILVLAVVALLPVIAQAADSRRRCDAQAVPGERLSRLARGFNLTSWLSSDNPRRPDLAVLASLHTRGFTHIRLPVAPEPLMAAFSRREAVEQRLAELDFALSSLIGLGFGVSLDLHPGGRLGRLHAASPPEGYRLIAKLWRQLAQRYSNRSADRMFFEVLNEPTVSAKIWNEQGPLLAQLIRREAPNHTIIYGPANYQQIGALYDLKPISDPNVVYAVHFYEPMVFTHQGLDWSDDPVRYLHGVPFPARMSDPAVVRLAASLAREGRVKSLALLQSQLLRPWTEERVSGLTARAGDWSMRNRKPVILNEFGVLGWKAAASDRARWIAAVRRAAETHCIGWTHWDYADAFGFVHRIGGREIPDETIVDALLKPGSASSPDLPKRHLN